MGDYGYVTLIPEIDAVKTTPQSRKLPFSHHHEITTPFEATRSATPGLVRIDAAAREIVGYNPTGRWRPAAFSSSKWAPFPWRTT